jgi:SWIM zinc finger
MPLTLAKVEQIAPDQGALDAARKLLHPQHWPTLARDDGAIVWGECQGSGSLPYRVAFSEADLGYKCTCPSRKLPCKHALALMWMRADGREFAVQNRPDWVSAWLGRRRGSATRRGASPEAEDERAPVSLAAVPQTVETAPSRPSPASEGGKGGGEARAAAQRERNRATREASILNGLEELDRWILDQVERGLAGFSSAAHEQCRVMARRLVDAKANGLATRVELLPAALLGLPEQTRADFLIERFGELHLVAEAYRRQADLPEALKADVRLTVGWTMSRDELLAEPKALRVRGRWMVLATRVELQPDRLRRIETWLGRVSNGEGPRFAVLMDFVPAAAGTSASPFSPGETLEAELVFYPSAAPLRAVIAEQSGGTGKEERWSAPPDDVTRAIGRYEAVLATRPWLGDWPIAVSSAVVGRTADGFVLADNEGRALPIDARDDDLLLPLIGIRNIDAFGLWNGRGLDLKFAETTLGRWVSD